MMAEIEKEDSNESCYLCICHMIVEKFYMQFGKQFSGSSKKKYDPAIVFLLTFSLQIKIHVYITTPLMKIHISIIFNSQKVKNKNTYQMTNACHKGDILTYWNIILQNS
jgi:hypothetical protein